MPELPLIPLRKVYLPDTDALLPYLKKIDANHRYANFGELCLEFEERLASYYSLSRTAVTTVCNATAGLTLALQASGAKPGQLCIMPSFTFPATPGAVMAAGLQPLFTDIERNTLMLSVQEVEALLGNFNNIGAVMPVSAFGAPVNIDEWEDFQKRTGVPVIIDAAWCFDTLIPGELLQVLSLHATKVLGIGEGGVVISKNEALIADVRRRTNFGLTPNRSIEIPAGNAKLSEYAAVVGHAALDEWPDRRKRHLKVQHQYLKRLSDLPGIESCLPWKNADWVTATMTVLLREKNNQNCIKELSQQGIEARAWWGACHHENAYTKCKRSELTVTEWVVDHVLNLPFSEDLTENDINRICVQLSLLIN